MILLVAALVVTQAIELYRVENRPAAELVPIARAALGADGQVTLDARTATLVLNGSPAAVGRALALLEQMDRPLHEVVVDVTVVELADVESLGARVAWTTTFGGVRVGTLPFGPFGPFGPDGLRVALGGSRSSTTTKAGSRLRLLEGGTGIVRTGRALPVLFASYWPSGWNATTELVPVDTGFEASARVVSDDEVFLELRPFAGRISESGELDYIGAATAVAVSPGETVVLAEVPREVQSSTTDLSGAQRDAVRHHQIVLLSVELER